jgi:hypothetical protein
MLHPPTYDVRTRAYCGPTAMAAVTGEPISMIRDAIRKARGKAKKSNGAAMPIMGVSEKDLIEAMSILGWKAVESDPFDICPLDDFLNHRGNDDGPFIVCGPQHCYAVSHGEICDTDTYFPKDIAQFKPDRNDWVERWWKFALWSVFSGGGAVKRRAYRGKHRATCSGRAEIPQQPILQLQKR